MCSVVVRIPVNLGKDQPL